MAILHFIPDADDPASLVAAYREALAPGSFLVLSHGTGDFHPAEVADAAASAYDSAAAPPPSKIIPNEFVLRLPGHHFSLPPPGARCGFAGGVGGGD